jgi:anti-sigma factor RsiW
MTDDHLPDAPAGSCERIGLVLSRLADGAETPSQRAEIDAHLPSCETCRRAALADAAVRRRLEERTNAPAPKWLDGFAGRTARLALAQVREARVQNRLLWMSAAAALLVAVTAQFALPGAAPTDAPSPAESATVRETTRLAVLRPPRLTRTDEGK